ncbi:hypothetical protein B0J14DRAFT_606210 [Halenospora varia]|nr:hypothetical protein B0J14DRAFT_606210 [Halenospora varia]
MAPSVPTAASIKGNLLDPASTMVIRDVVPGITTLSVPFELAGKVKTGGRGTIVKLSTGSLAVFSPVSLTQEVRAKVEKLGILRYIVALNIEHHLFISSWAGAFPGAEVIGMEGLPEKREKSEATSGVKFTHVFTTQNKTSKKISSEFDTEFGYEYVDSHQNKELVFFHKPTGTLIEADVLFNLPATEQYSRTQDGAKSSVLTKFVVSLLHAEGDVKWQKRILWYLSCSSDREGFGQSAKRILNWDFDRIIPCHGDVIESGGKKVLERLTEWFREGKQ